MTNDPYISFKKAADLAGVSKKTVERFHTKHKDHPEYTDAFEHRPDAKGAKYFIKESVVLHDIVKNGTEKSTSNSDTGTAQQVAVNEVINQLKVKDEQLKEKDKQIENLQSSLHQEQELHGRAQEKAHPSLIKSAILMLVGRKEHEETALRLAESRGLTEIKQQITWLPKRKVSRNPLGMLRSAIEQDWSAPVEIQERERNRESAQKEKVKEVAKAAEIDDVNRAKQERRQNRQQALPRWNVLSKENHSTIEQSAYERLNSDFYRKLFRTNDDFHLEKCLDELCRQEKLAPATTLVAK